MAAKEGPVTDIQVEDPAGHVVTDTQVGDPATQIVENDGIMDDLRRGYGQMEIVEKVNVSSTIGAKRKAPDGENKNEEDFNGDMHEDVRGRDAKRPRTVPPLHMWIWIDGKLARALFDTGCNTFKFSIDESFARRNGIKMETSKDPFNIN